MTVANSTSSTQPTTVITPEALLEHWQGHRRLTRRVIESFPEDQLFIFRVPPMRPFGLMALEFIGMGVPMARTLAGQDPSGAGSHHDPTWVRSFTEADSPKTTLLARWDEDTKEIDALWPQIPPSRFQETITAFGQFTGVASGLLMYVIDNEIHHRGQGYVYLRHLGIDTPLFYIR